MVKLGIYQHYKNGKKYKVIANGLLESTGEPVVVYEAMYDNSLSKIWVRPEKEFMEEIDLGNVKVPRFKFVGE